MSYIINKRDGTQLTTVLDGTTDTTATSLTLVGQNYVGWGEIFQENLVHLMENFARSALPANALVGQLWFDTTNKELKVLVAEDTWRPLATTASGTLPPADPNVGDFWYDTSHRQVKVWNSTGWQIIGPVYTAQQGPTGANAVSIADSLNTPRTVVTLESQGATFAIFNPNSEFLTLDDVPGFGNTIYRGFSFRSNINSDVLFHGTVENAMTIQSIPLESLLRGDIDDHTSGNLAIRNNDGLWVGALGELKITYDGLDDAYTYGNVRITAANERNIRIVGTHDNGERVMLQSNIVSGLLSVYDDPLAPKDISTKHYTDTTVNDAEQRTELHLRTNVAAINNSLGILTTELNRVNNFAQNLFVIKANLASPALTGTPTAPTVGVTDKSTTLATTAFVHSVVPTGVILMWSGAVSAVPAGWALCNGGNGTPDLRDRFIVGAGSGYTVGQFGGNNTPVITTATAGTHDHGTQTGGTVLNSSQLPVHTHNFTDVYAIVGDYQLGGSTASPYDRNGNYIYPSFYVAGNASDGDRDNGVYGFPSRTDAAGSGSPHTHSISSGGGHQHDVTITPTLPLYYALCYIMKTA